ncbi:MAG: hypothetical protein QM724_02270 [Flavobacteriales bacterium]
MKHLRATILIMAAALSALPLLAQRPELNTQADVEERVKSALEADKAQGKLAELALELGLRGSFTFDLTVGDRGEAETVFPVESTIEDIPARNRLKDHLKSLRFDFKLPKGKRFKTRQTLQFP